MATYQYEGVEIRVTFGREQEDREREGKRIKRLTV